MIGLNKSECKTQRQNDKIPVSHFKRQNTSSHKKSRQHQRRNRLTLWGSVCCQYICLLLRLSLSNEVNKHHRCGGGVLPGWRLHLVSTPQEPNAFKRENSAGVPPGCTTVKRFHQAPVRKCRWRGSKSPSPDQTLEKHHLQTSLQRDGMEGRAWTTDLPGPPCRRTSAGHWRRPGATVCEVSELFAAEIP